MTVRISTQVEEGVGGQGGQIYCGSGAAQAIMAIILVFIIIFFVVVDDVRAGAGAGAVAGAVAVAGLLDSKSLKVVYMYEERLLL